MCVCVGLPTKTVKLRTHISLLGKLEQPRSQSRAPGEGNILCWGQNGKPLLGVHGNGAGYAPQLRNSRFAGTTSNNFQHVESRIKKKKCAGQTFLLVCCLNRLTWGLGVGDFRRSLLAATRFHHGHLAIQSTLGPLNTILKESS